MPHSSGGGSHGGGSHGGSHGGSSHGGSRGPRISRTSFSGARRYSYYRHGQQRYFYADKNFKPGFHPSRLLIGLLYLPFVFGGITEIKSALPIVPKNYDHNIVLNDEADVIDNEDALYVELERFMEKTGVTPSVVTVHNEAWENFDSLEDYAYNRYLQEFDDEMHWLIVYSEPIDPDPSFNDWYWEGMQGDDTDPVITVEKANEFNSSLYGALFDGTDFATAVKTSFSEFTDNYSRSFNFGNMFPGLFILGFVSFHAYFMLGLNELKYRNAVLDDDDDVTYPIVRTFNDPTVQVQSYQDYKSSKAYNSHQQTPIHDYDSYTPKSNMDDLYGLGNSGAGSKNIVCQYCGSTFAAKYRRCPQCNAENPDYL